MSEKKQKMGLGHEMVSMVKTNIRDYMMYIALICIMAFFAVKTNGGFLQPRNIANLINQAGYVAVLAIGMTVILIIVHIDLSVGYVAGFCGAVAAILMTKYNVNQWVAILIVLILGILIGLYQGLLVTKLGVPAFVTTLAGMFIFRGLLNLSLQETGTIIISNEGFNALSNGFIPDLPVNASFHVITMIVGVLLVMAMIYSQIKDRKNKQKYHFEVCSTPIFVVKMVAFSAVIMVIMWTLAKFRGIPWTAVIVGVVLMIYNYMLNKTKLGRAIYGIGGNAQAAELSGINVKKVTLFAFCSVSLMAALAGILYTSRLQSATPTAGAAFEMDAIASCFIGGASAYGGSGSVGGVVIGALLLGVLNMGMSILGFTDSWQYVVKGSVLLVAVIFDVVSKRKKG